MPARAPSRPALPSARAAAHRPALAVLLAHYVAGRIADGRWAAISAALDALPAGTDARAAFAAFCLDAGEEAALPSPAEIEDLLEATVS